MATMRTAKRSEKCYVCGSSKTGVLKMVDDYPLYSCGACELKWAGVQNRHNTAAFYGEKYFNNDSKTGYRDYLADEDNHRRNARHILAVMDTVTDISGSSVLDVGCAFGFFLDEARKLKRCRTFGVEVSRCACDYAANKLGLDVFNGVIGATGLKQGSFDAAFMIGTIEHLKSPRQEIVAVNRALKNGGLLAITTIDTRGIFPVYSVKIPEHIFYFNRKNLALLLNKAGFTIVLAKPYFVSYYIHDLIFRLGQFLSISFLSRIADSVKKSVPGARVNIPTNEMIVIAKKVTAA